jgi:hypothetical protein
VLQDLRISVGHTWRFATPEGVTTVSEDLGGYRAHIDQLKNNPAADAFGLPWPPYRSTLWAYMFGDGYRDTPSYTLVGGLLPLLRSDGLPAPGPVGAEPGPPPAFLDAAEAFFHPFAITTLAHLSVPASVLTAAQGQEPVLFDRLIHLPLTAGQAGQVRDGAPVAPLPGLASRDFGRLPASYQSAGTFIVLSGVHQAPDPKPLAYRLASLYQKTAPDKSQPMNTDLSAISVTDRQIAMLMPDQQPARSHLGCLHRNICTLLACMENMAAIVGPAANRPATWFQRRAALLLNCLHRRAPLPGSGQIYKSRVAQMWIDHLGLAAAINQVNTEAEQPVPALS